MITLSSNSINFGSLSKGESITKRVTVFNTGATSVDVTAITSSSADYVAAPTLFTVNAYSSIDFSIEYTADLVAGSTSIITMTNTAGPALIINVVATVLTPTMTLDTSDLIFGKVAVNDSKTLQKIITNTSSSSAILNITVSSNDVNFTVNQSTININPGSSTNLIISFSPIVVGTPSATIQIVANDATETYSINVDGECVIPTYTVPTSINFGSLPINDTKQVTFNLTNTDTEVNLIVSSVTIPDSQITIDISSATINPGMTQVFTVSFTPLSSAILSNFLTLVTNAGGIIVNYTGTGLVVPLVSFNTSLIAYDIYPINITKYFPLIIQSTGVVDVIISSINFPTVSDTNFSIDVTLPLVVPHGESLTINVSVNSTANVDFVDVITIVSDSFTSPDSIDISGSARSAVITVDTNQLDFGTISVGQFKSLLFVVNNVGDVDLNVAIVNSAHFVASLNTFTINPGLSQVVSLTFFIEAPGDVVEQIIINSNDPINSTVTIDVIGSANFDHNFVVVPDSIIVDFISKDIENIVQVAVINSSLYDASIDGFVDSQLTSATATYTITSTDFPVSLAPGQTASINLHILASNIGSIAGQIQFNTRVGTSLQFNTQEVVQYSGQVFSPTIIVSTNNIQFDDTAVSSVSYKSFTITNDDVNASLTAQLSINVSQFGIKQSSSQILASPDSAIIDVNQVKLVLQSISLIDSVTNQVFTLGNPNVYDQFSANTDTGILTLNSATKGKSFTITYDYKKQIISLQIVMKSSVTINVGFFPDMVNSFSGTITISSNDIINPVETIALSGNGLPAFTSLIKVNDLVKFDAKIGKTLIQRQVLKNTGNIKLFVNSIDIAAPFSIDNDVFAIDPGETYELPTTFTATNAVQVTQNIVIHSNAPDLTITLVGQGHLPQISVPLSFNFGQVAINTTSKQDFIITNLGLASLEISVVTIDSDKFSASPSTTTVAASSTYTISLSFTPDAISTYNVGMMIVSDDPNTPNLFVAITGEGVKKPTIRVPAVINFSQTNIKETSQMQLTVENIGSDDLQITSMTSDNTVFTPLFIPIATIAAGSSQDFTINFMPRLQGTAANSGALTIYNNDNVHPAIQVLLKGEGFAKDGEWSSFDLQDMMPKSIITLAQSVNSVIPPIKTILSLIKQVLDIVKVLLVDTSSMLKPILEAVKLAIENFLQDLESTGLYLLPIYPSSTYTDPNLQAKTAFGKYLASVGGGSETFKKKVIDSFDDVFDSHRPQFTDDAQVAALVIAVDSGNVADIVKGIMSLSKIFTSITSNPDMEPPNDVSAVSGDSTVVLRWGLPEFVEFNVGALFNKQPLVEMIDHFSVYRVEAQSTMAVATQDYFDPVNVSTIISRKGDTIDATTKKRLDWVGRPIPGSSFKFQLQNFAVGWKDNGHTSNTLGYEFADVGVSNGKNYYYAVRSFMGPTDPQGDSSSRSPASPLSNEVLGAPKKTNVSTINAGLNRCSFYTCVKKSYNTKKVVMLSKPIVKNVNRTGEILQAKKRTEANGIQPNAGIQQTNVFTFSIPDINVDISTLKVRNTTVANLILTDNSQKVDTKQFIDGTTIKAWDDNTTSAEGKTLYFNTLDTTKAILGYNLQVSKTTTHTIFTITDIFNMHYSAADVVVVEYYNGSYSANCGNAPYKGNFDSTTCANGTTKCPGLKNRRCVYNNGTTCLNVGYTSTNNKSVQNKLFFDPVDCLTGAKGGDVNFFDKQFRNDSSYSIKTSGICAGYVSVDEQSIGQFPDWYSISAVSLIKPVEDFMKALEDWVNKEIAAIQKGSETVTQFIDLLAKKIDALGEFIDQLQKIIEIFTSIFSVNAGFYILMIPADTGGSARIKSMIQSASNGPSSGASGYTAGIVLLAGGPNVGPIWQFLQLFFK